MFLNSGQEGANEANGTKDLKEMLKGAKEVDHYDTRSEVSSSDEDAQSHISNPSLSSASFKSDSGKQSNAARQSLL